MDLKSLRCFVAVAEKLNFSRAAEELFISQPALSARISALEDEWGVQLFRRTKQKVFLTPAGSALLPEVQNILERIDRLDEFAKDASKKTAQLSGKIVIGLDDTVPEVMLSDLTSAFQSFRATYPDIRIITEQVLFHDIENDLLSRKIDICFACLKKSETLSVQFNSYVLSTDPMVLAYMGAPLDSAEDVFAKRELLFLEGEDRWNDLLIRYLENKKIRPVTRNVRGGPAMVAMLLPEDTATMMPISFYNSLNYPNLHHFVLDIPEAYTISCLIWDKLNYNPALQLFINCFHRKPSIQLK